MFMYKCNCVDVNVTLIILQSSIGKHPKGMTLIMLLYVYFVCLLSMSVCGSVYFVYVYFVCLLSMSVCGSVPTLLYRLPSDPAPWFEQDESHKFPYGCKQLQPHTFNEDFGPVSACPDQPTIRVDPYASPL